MAQFIFLLRRLSGALSPLLLYTFNSSGLTVQPFYYFVIVVPLVDYFWTLLEILCQKNLLLL